MRDFKNEFTKSWEKIHLKELCRFLGKCQSYEIVSLNNLKNLMDKNKKNGTENDTVGS